MEIVSNRSGEGRGAIELIEDRHDDDGEFCGMAIPFRMSEGAVIAPARLRERWVNERTTDRKDQARAAGIARVLRCGRRVVTSGNDTGPHAGANSRARAGHAHRHRHGERGRMVVAETHEVENLSTHTPRVKGEFMSSRTASLFR